MARRRFAPAVLAAVSLLALLAGPAKAGVITPNVLSDTPSLFDLQLTHFFPNDDHTTVITGGINWNLSMTVVEDSVLNDELDVTFEIFHKIPPHGEGVGPVFNRTFAHINASNYGAGFNTVNLAGLPDAQGHGPHRDVITTAYVKFFVVKGTFVDDISQFEIRLRVVHTPEPSSLAMAGGALLIGALTTLRRRRRRVG